MIALHSSVTANLQSRTHGLEGSEKTATRVDYHHATHTELQQKFLVESTSEIMRSGAGDSRLDDKPSEITHAGEEVRVPTVVGKQTGCPEVDVENKGRARDGPRKH
jgi:hypothetical protein